MFSQSLLAKIKNAQFLNNFSNINTKVITDSRKIASGDTYFAIKGNVFNGEDFVEQAILGGAISIVVSNDREWKSLADENLNVFFVVVPDTIVALQELSIYRLKEWDQKKDKTVIGITGSNGKTTTKEMMASILERAFPKEVCFTRGNFNNHIGVPLTILSIKNEDSIAVIEMGSNHPGEIKFLCDLVQPSSGLITNIGASHLEFLESEEGVFLEKKSLYDEVARAENKRGLFIINGDDHYLKKLPRTKNSLYLESGANYQLRDDGAVLIIDEVSYKITNSNILHQYNWNNMALAFSLCLSLFPRKSDELLLGAKEYCPPANNRSQLIHYPGGRQIFLDAYNANPSSMESSLRDYFDQVGEFKSETLLVLGDMNELGGKSEKYHEELGSLVFRLGASSVLYVGENSLAFGRGYKKKFKNFGNVESLASEWLNLSKNFKYIFIKGSRSLQLERLIDITRA